MIRSNQLLSVGRNGEIIYHGLNSHMSHKFKADTAFDKPFVAYVVMLLCGAIDAMCFINLFSLISYDSPFILGMQVCGLLVGFDLIPCYLGIHLRRLKQGLTKDKFIVWFALSASAIAFLINIVLRISTIKLMSPDGIVDANAISLTVFGCFIPFVTSLASFFVSYLLYNPLQVRKKNIEILMYEKQDEIRRLQAFLDEYEMESDFGEHLVKDDEEKYEAMLRYQIALVLGYCDLVRQRMKEHLGTPSASNALSEETCASILNRLDQELTALYITDFQRVHTGVNKSKRTTVLNDAAA